MLSFKIMTVPTGSPSTSYNTIHQLIANVINMVIEAATPLCTQSVLHATLLCGTSAIYVLCSASSRLVVIK